MILLFILVTTCFQFVPSFKFHLQGGFRGSFFTTRASQILALGDGAQQKHDTFQKEEETDAMFLLLLRPKRIAGPR